MAEQWGKVTESDVGEEEGDKWARRLQKTAVRMERMGGKDTSLYRCMIRIEGRKDTEEGTRECRREIQERVRRSQGAVVTQEESKAWADRQRSESALEGGGKEAVYAQKKEEDAWERVMMVSGDLTF